MNTPNLSLYNKWEYLKDTPKIIYALTPPPRLANIGDHAQVVAIQEWFNKHFKLPIVEIDKDEAVLLDALKALIRPDDLIFLHSGGNMADRAMWSENARRGIIKTFLNNRIISLPQTISFGHKQQLLCESIYSNHPNLTIIARDLESEKLAKKIFSKATTFAMPDFVLGVDYISPLKKGPKEDRGFKVLACLRDNDGESILTEAQRESICKIFKGTTARFDTTFKKPIQRKDRVETLFRTLVTFDKADLIITDRFHGVIFSVLCKKPCVVLNTVDHKLRSSIQWFKDIKFVKLAETLEDIPQIAKEVMTVTDMSVPDWNKEYFDKLPARLGL